MDFSKHILTVQNFPKEGVLFYDITPLLANPEAYRAAIDLWAAELEKFGATKIIAAESRGFFFASAIAMKMALPFIPVRKKGKLPRETVSAEIELEYGKDLLFMHKDAISPDDRVIILDDILATGGTATGMCEMVKTLGALPVCCTFFMELGFLKGREKLECCCPVLSIKTV